MTNVDKSIVDDEIIKKINDNKKYNEIILEYYEKFISEFNNGYENTIRNKITNMSKCNEFWFLEKFELPKEKHLLNQNLCRDKFCSNCKKATQASRMAKYNDELKTYKDRLYHLTLTVPNVKGSKLKETVKHMQKCFKYLIEYIRGSRKTKDIDFESWGYEGAVRSLEVTFNNDRKESYHPHYHVALVLNDDILSKKNIENKYSYDFYTDNGIPLLNRFFNKEEILIQKIWYLLINKIRVNKKNIDSLDIGYSCSIDKFEEDKYAELFKYITKEKDEKGQVLTYDNFRHLYYGLYRIKQIQGYGCLYKIKEDIDIELFEDMYEEYLESLRQKEKSSRVLQTPEELLLDYKYKIISKKLYFEYLRDTYFLN